MRLPAFPLDWDYRRVCEVLVAWYSSSVGFVFLTWPATLDRPIYARFGGSEAAPLLGWSLMVCALLHAAAMVLNGYSRRWSTPARRLACAAHGVLIFTFASNFALEGAWWAFTSMTLVLVLIYLAFHRACSVGEGG